jgi:tRNA-splicing ligase RtcB
MSERKDAVPRVERWLAEPVPREVALSISRLASAEDVAHVAVMPDVHLSGDVCVGLAVATSRLIYPAAVGGDIGCGMAAVAIDAGADLLSDRGAAESLLAGLTRAVPAMRHSRATMPELPNSLHAEPLSHPRLQKLLSRDGRVQFGTLGRGNHFLEFQADEQDRLWIMLHSGSRAMGQAITTHHVAIAEQLSCRKRLPSLDSAAPEGRAYLADVSWAIRYASESRLAMLRAAEQVLHDLFGMSLQWDTLIHANHNHVRPEAHFGQPLFVHRKGALPAGVGEPGVIPGSMGSASFHVTGRGCEASLASSSPALARPEPRRSGSTHINTTARPRDARRVVLRPPGPPALR